MAIRKPQAPVACTGGFYPPNTLELTSPDFLAKLASDLSVEGLASAQIVFQAIERLLSCEIDLYGFDKNPIDLFSEYRDGLDVIEWAFGGDWSRGMRRLLERAKRPFSNRMKATPQLLMRVLLLHYAREIQKQATISSSNLGHHGTN